jgi:hypothetical protein
MRKSLLLFGAALMVFGAASTANAMHGQQWGLGLVSTDTPVGVFYGINDKTNIHVGLGFEKNDLPDMSTEIETTFGITGQVMFDIWQGNGMGFGVYPGINFTNYSPKEGDSASQTIILIHLGGHWDPNDWVSLWFQHGFQVVLTSPPAGDSTTDFRTAGLDLGSFGVTFWIP